MSTIDYTTLASHLAEIPDPRSPRGRRYEWHYLLILIAAAMLTGASMPTAISHWVQVNQAALIAALRPARKSVPSMATIRRALCRVPIEALEKALGAYQAQLARETGDAGTVVTMQGETLRGAALDGKVVRGASAHGESVHLVSLMRRRYCILVLFNAEFVNGPTRWHLDPVKNMGLFMDDASHATDFLHWMLGRPLSVMAEIDNTITDVAPDDTGVAIYRYASGAIAVLLNSSVTLAGENTTEVYGDEGVIIQNHDDGPSTNVALPPHPVALKLYRRGETQWQDFGIAIPASHAERIAAVPRAFVDCIKYDLAPPTTAEDGRVSVEMVLGAYQSAREGRRVHFPLEP